MSAYPKGAEAEGSVFIETSEIRKSWYGNNAWKHNPSPAIAELSEAFRLGGTT